MYDYDYGSKWSAKESAHVCPLSIHLLRRFTILTLPILPGHISGDDADDKLGW